MQVFFYLIWTKVQICTKIRINTMRNRNLVQICTKIRINVCLVGLFHGGEVDQVLTRYCPRVDPVVIRNGMGVEQWVD